MTYPNARRARVEHRVGLGCLAVGEPPVTAATVPSVGETCTKIESFLASGCAVDFD